jgi:UDP-glucuronate 4-epimerase
MRIVVTGAGGFIGSHLVEALLADGHDVVGVEGFTSYYDPARKRANLQAALESQRFELVEGDLGELDLPRVLADADVVHHLAGQPGVRVSWGEGFSSYLTQNVHTTQRLLEAAREVRLPRFVLASSSSIYGQAERFPTKETDEPRPVSPYGMTKLAAEQLCRVYGSQFDVPWVVLRYFSIFGPRQRPDMAFSHFIDALAAGQTLPINGDGGQSRDFTYVGDAVAATVAAGERGVVGGVYNVAGGCQATVLEVIETLATLTGHVPQLDHRPPVAGDPRRTGADITRAREELGYVPAVGLEEGLSRQVEAQRAVGVRR